MPIFTPAPPLPVPVAVASDLGTLAYDYLPYYMRRADEVGDQTVADLMASMGASVAAVVALLTAPDAQVDPERAPFDRLPWLAAMAGVDIDGVPNADLRAWLADPDNYYRGNEQTIARRVGLTLTGSKSVTIECPYGGDPMAILVRTITGETPDEAATEAAVRREIPAWLVLTYEAVAGLTYAELSAEYATYADLEATGYTYAQLQELT